MPRKTDRWAALIATFCAVLAINVAHAAEEVVSAFDIVDMKAVFARVEPRDVAAARARIGGTLVEIHVTEGSAVVQGQRIALVADDKLGPSIGVPQTLASGRLSPNWRTRRTN